MKWLHLLLCVTSVLGKNVQPSGVAPMIKLNDGNDMPSFGLGTWLGFLQKGSAEEVQGAVEAAIDAGYRHIDTAHIYNTEEQVGKGLKKKIEEGVVKREDVFITTKDTPSPAKAPTANLNDGNVMPRFGLGTSLGLFPTGSKEEVRDAVEAAIDAGYRLIDTASIYNTKEQVALGLKNKIDEGVVKREEMFITTKVCFSGTLTDFDITKTELKDTPSPARAPTWKLSDGNVIPRFGLGTWLGFIEMGPKEEVRDAVETAIDAGYRLIDTASIYNTEEQVALGLKKKIDEGVVKREEMFITTKDTPSSPRAPTWKLSDGNVMPRFGLGTWLGFIQMGPKEEVRGAVEAAIDAGYRLIDTASFYNTEDEVRMI
ncbi:unnamed protein product [Danaus chrysippus]|uniref:(African queen) hypothetical protein n=1 Tax=Danaus chrysippus TaxID=151541 RepID=A0A8J2R834_9NEOP|nr:unnamed protein product [Danaus chrysippus]